MANPSVPHSSPSPVPPAAPPSRSPWRVERLPLTGRRLAAWTVEVGFIALSAIAPYQVGAIVNHLHDGATVPMNPLLTTTTETISRTLALPRSAGRSGIAPLTNIFWSIAVLAPVVVGGSQLYQLAKTGQTLPKQWLKLRVVTANHQSPGVAGVVLREGVGRWGIPLSLAYLIWRYSGAFPGLGILTGLSGLGLVLGAASAYCHAKRRPFHDRLAGTLVVDATYPQATATSTFVYPPDYPLPHETAYSLDETGAMTAIILSPQTTEEQGLWRWMQAHPGTTVVVGAVGGLVLILGTFIGTQVYVQHQANQRELRAQEDEVFMALVNQISASTQKPVAERQAAILTLGTIDDHRAIPLLVDLLAQETNGAVMNTIQQALITIGPEAIAPLQRLNQALESDLTTLNRNGNPANQPVLLLRQRTTQQAIAKILNLYSGRIQTLDLSRTNLSRAEAGTPPFVLVLDQADLGGVNLRGSRLIGASLRGTQFYHPGTDGRYGTYDDRSADLSGAELKEADLINANFEQATLVRTSFVGARLDRANFQAAQATGANFSSARLIQANFQRTALDEASFAGADLTDANLAFAHLPDARLGQVSAIRTNFASANLVRSEWSEADLAGVNLSKARLQAANFQGARLTGADLQGANLTDANFTGATLVGALLQGANLTNANFQDVVWASAAPATEGGFITAPASTAEQFLRGVNFNGVQNLSADQLSYICAQGGTHTACAGSTPPPAAAPSPQP